MKLACSTVLFCFNYSITVFDAILTGRQSGQKLQCLYGNPMANNFNLPKLNFTQFVSEAQLIFFIFHTFVCTFYANRVYLAKFTDKCKGQFTQAIFAAATGCNVCRAKVATSFQHVRNPCDIAATIPLKIAIYTCDFEVAT